MQKQVIFIHGGETFDTYEEYVSFLKSIEIDPTQEEQKKWKHSLQDRLGADFYVLAPSMPNKLNAKYSEWKIWFDKYVPFFQNDILLAGHSLGGIFLAKYLSENILPVSIGGLFLVAAPFNDQHSEYSLADFILSDSLPVIQERCSKIFVYHSKDDPVVPFGDCEKYQHAFPRASIRIFEDRGHINQEEFPELIADMRSC